MKSIVKALLWERWKIIRWGFLLACLFTFLGRLMYLAGFYSLEKSALGSKFFWFIGFLSLALTLLTGHCQINDIKASFPERLFRYPVSTAKLLAIYTGYGTAAVAAQALIFFGFEILFFDSVNVSWHYFIIFETTFIVLQTISWLSWVPGTFYHLLLCFLTSGTLFFSMYLLLDDGNNFLAGIIVLCFVIIPVCYGISFLSVRMHRHNTLNFKRKWADKFLKIFRGKQSGPFASAMEAQTWLESRQTGYLFPFTFICIIVPILILILVINIVMSVRFENYIFPPLSSVNVFLLPLSMLAALLAGMFSIAVYSRNQGSEASSFRMRFPISTREMAAARFRSYIASIARVFALLILISLVLILFDWRSGDLNVRTLTPVKWALKYDSTIEIITMTLLGLYGYLLYCWTMLFIGSEMLGLFGFAAVLIWITKFFIGDVAAEYLLYILLAAVPVLTIAAFYKARGRNLITSSTVLISVLMFPLAVLFLWAYPWYYTVADLPKGMPDLPLTGIIYIIAAAAVPFIPVAFTPLIMDKLRHR